MRIVNTKNLEKKSFSALIRTMNTCVSNIVENRALVIKIVSIIEDTGSWQKRKNYSKAQLKQLKEAGLDTPWKAELRYVLEGLNPLFSYSEYVRYLKLMKKLDLSTSARLHPDALKFLNTYRYSKDINNIVADLERSKGIITKEDSMTTVYRYIKKRVVQEEETRKINRKKRPVSMTTALQRKNRELRAEIALLKQENEKLKRQLKYRDNKIKKLAA